MSDRFACMITFGGEIKSELTDELMAAINDDGCLLDWDDSGPEMALDDIIDCTGPVVLFNLEGRYGQCENLEEFLQENNMPFVRSSQAYAEYDAETVWWFPGMKAPKTVNSDNDGTVLIKVHEVLDLLNQKTIGEVKQILGEIIPPNVPKLKIIS
jgi:hypothetical protein